MKNEFKEFYNLKDSNLNNDGLFIAEGEKLVEKLLVSDLDTLKVIGPADYINNLKNLNENVEFLTIEKDQLETIVGHKLHKGIMALAKIPKNLEISNLTYPAVALDGVSSPENVGSIMRSAAAFNIKSVIVGPDSCSPYNRRCVRVSMGNVFKLNVRHSNDLKEDLEQIKAKALVLSTANVKEAINIDNYNFEASKNVVVIGSEGHGIKDSILKSSNRILKIPIDPFVSHLNAAVAASIFFYKLSCAQSSSLTAIKK